MPLLKNTRHERICQLYADGLPMRTAYREVFQSEFSKGEYGNSTRFFRRDDIRSRIREIRERRALLADLDDGWVLLQLKAVAKNAITHGNANLDDFFRKDANGKRIAVDLESVPSEKMAALEEVTVEEVMEGRGENAQRIRRTKIKLRSSANALQALELIGKHIGMWNPEDRMIPSNRAVVEVCWSESTGEAPALPAPTTITLTPEEITPVYGAHSNGKLPT